MSQVARYITDAIDRSAKSQAQISKQIGFENPNMITMIKQGRTKLPLDRIEAFSYALPVDRYELLDLAMREYHPDAWATIRKTLAHTDQCRWAHG